MVVCCVLSILFVSFGTASTNDLLLHPCVVRFAANSELQEARIRFLQRVKAEVFKAKREGKLNSSGTKGVLFPIRLHPYVCTFLRMACILRTRPTTRKTTLFIVGSLGPLYSTCTYTHT